MSDHPKEHGLLFKPDMVGAYFAGCKSMTRRVITRRNSYVDGEPASKEVWDELQFDRAWIDKGPSPAGNLGPYLKVPRPWFQNGMAVDETVHRIYPRYQIEDVIWGRETWAIYDLMRDPKCFKEQIAANEDIWMYRGKAEHKHIDHIVYAADLEPGIRARLKGAWRPSIFLPRWAARIVTPIVAVRPERIQDINEEDAVAEGVAPVPDELIWTVLKEDGGSYQCFTEPKDKDGIRDYVKSNLPGRTAAEGFRNLWESINGKKHPWFSNPLVWTITFKAYEK